MDTVGDADALLEDEEPAPGPPRLLTAETRAVAGAGLVLMSVASSGIFQYTAFLFLSRDGSSGQTTQYLILAGPCALLAALGAASGWSTRGQPLTPGLRGVAGAAVVVGAALVVLVAASLVLGLLLGTDNNNGF